MAVRVSHPKFNLLRWQDRRRRSKRCLMAQEVERLDGMRPGDTILCTNGVLWVTQEGDPVDYLLKKGDKFLSPTGRPGPVQAVDDCACRFWRKS
jgi:hypothetical protein